jgi:hypothetical protein
MLLSVARQLGITLLRVVRLIAAAMAVKVLGESAATILELSFHPMFGGGTG